MIARKKILLGVIGRPHGVRGLVHVHSHTENPADLTAYGDLSDAQGRHFIVRWRGEGVAEIAIRSDGGEQKITDHVLQAHNQTEQDLTEKEADRRDEVGLRDRLRFIFH